MVDIITRAAWGARQPRSVSHNITPQNGGIAGHYEGPHMGWPWEHASCITKVRGIQAYHMDHHGWVDIAYCVDVETEILTREGWKTHEALTTEDTVLTLNHDTGLSEWQPVLEVCRFDAPEGGREMIRMEGMEHSSLTTPNHRWPVERRRRSEGVDRQRDTMGRFAARTAPAAPRVTTGWDRKFVTTETLGYWDRIPIAAMCADVPTDQKYTDALVEAVAWMWTEGHIVRLRDGSQSKNVCIYQSHVKNENNVARIDSALRTVFGPPVEAMPRMGSRTDGVPRWRHYVNRHKMEFYLNADAGRILLQHAPNRVPTADFLSALTQAQLDLFIHISMLADNSGPSSLAQKSKGAAEAFQFAAILAGYGTSLKSRKPTASTPYQMWEVRLKKKTHFSPVPARNNKNGVFSISREIYDDIVWCPRTLNQTWLARRNGSVYFTGNTAIVCPHGYAFEGRWLGVRSAANGTNDANQNFYAICFLGGQGDDFTDPAKHAFLDLVDIFRAQGKAGASIKPHRAFISTACPGDPFFNWINQGCPRPGGQPVPTPPSPPPPPAQPSWRDRVRAKPVLKAGASGQNVRILQGAMTAHGALPVSVNGGFGAQTESSLRSWQQRTGTLAADGVCGPNTWEWLLGTNDPPLLHNGVQSFAVRLLQGLMLAHGATPVTVDGTFGGQTESSLRSWQQRTGVLAVDGVAGPATWSWLCGC